MYCYVTVVSLQYLTPLILMLNCTLLLKTLGEKNQPGRERGGARGWGCNGVCERRAWPGMDRGEGEAWR